MANRSHPVITPDRPEMADSLGFDPSCFDLEVLSIFLDELRGAGYNLGVDQYVAVNNLVLVLVTQGDGLRQPEQFASFMGPIVCSNVREQEDFQIRFQRWLPALIKPIKPDPLSLNGKQTPELLTPAIPPAPSRSRWWWGGLAFGLLLALAIVGEIFSNRSQNPPDPIPIPSVAPEPTASVAPQPTVSVAPLPSLSPTPVPPVPTPDPKNIDIPTWQIALAIFSILAGMTFLVWRSWWQWRAKLFLNRYATKMDLELEAVSFPAIEQELFPRLVFLHIAQQLRQRVSLNSSRIAIQATITQSLRQGGWFTPVYGQRQVLPEYLVLIDRSSYGDHQARLVTEILNCLVDNQVLVKHFYFNDSPQICTPETITEPPQSLKELAAHYFQHRLLIFAQAEQFFDPMTGEVELWVQRLEPWSDRAIFTPKALDQWGYPEFKLGSDFLILPATPEGLKCLIPRLNDRQSSLSTQQKRSLLPRSLRHYPQRWVERYPVDDQTVTDVLAALKRYLGEDGFLWLSACAIFPEVRWPITLYLGNTLENGAGQKLLNRIPFIELVALPWFRWGYMPDWLRLKLIQGLSPDSDQQIRNTFRKLLTDVFLNDEGQLKLHIAEQKSPDFLKQFTEFLLQTFGKQEIDRNPFQDQIFVEFMNQNRSVLLLELPQTQQWRDWLKTPTKVGRWLLVFLGLSAVTAGLTFLARRQPLPFQIAQQTPTPIPTSDDPTPSEPAVYFRTIKEVPNVPSMIVRYGGSTNLAPLRCNRTGNEPICRDPDNNLELRIIAAHPQFDLRYTNPFSSDEKPGSGSGIRMLLDKQISFAHSSRPLEGNELKRGIEAIPIAIDGIAIYVSPEVLNNVKSLTRSQLKDIFTCKETNWRSFGGQNLSIVPISRDPEDGGTPEFFKDNVLTGEEFGACIQSDPGYIYSTTDSIRKVNTTPGAISYASASEVCNQETIPVSRELTSDPISPCIESEVNRNAFLEDVYPINRRVFVIVRKDQSLDAEAGRAYVDMVLSDEGQQLVEKAGFISLRQL